MTTSAEIKIERLENKIEILKKEIPVEKRIEFIKQRAKERECKNENELNTLYESWDKLRDKVYRLQDRIVPLLRTSTALYDYDFNLPDDTNACGCADKKTDGKIRFCSKTWGALTLRIENNSCLDIELDGCSTDEDGVKEYYINVPTEYYEDMENDGSYSWDECIVALKNSIECMETFVSQYDKFEYDFYNYVDNLEI